MNISTHKSEDQIMIENLMKYISFLESYVPDLRDKYEDREWIYSIM